MWQCWIILILAIWLIIGSFVLVGETTGCVVNNLVVGIIIAALALWAGLYKKGGGTPSA